MIIPAIIKPITNGCFNLYEINAIADATIIITEKSWIICPIAISVTIITNYLKNKEYNNQMKFLK